MSGYVGSDFDDFLKQEGILEEVEALAIKRLIAVDIQRAMEDAQLTKTQMAERMHTSRAQLDRLLDPENSSVTLATLAKAAAVLGKKLHVTLDMAA
jgi:predicted XRE-type DNA-binding protein